MKGSRRAPLFFSLKSISRILCVYLGLHLVNILLCELRLAFFDVVVKIEVNQVLRLFSFFIAHTESGSPSLYALQLILKYVATAVALDDE